MNKKKIALIISYLVVTVLCFMLFSYKFKISEIGFTKYDTLQNKTEDNIIGKVKDGDVISQQINLERNNFKRIYIYFNTKDVINKNGTYKFEIKDLEGNVKFSDEITYVKASRNSVCKIDVKGVESGNYTVNFTYSGDETDFVPLVNKNYENNQYFINGQEETGLIQTEILFLNKIKSIVFYVLMIIIWGVFSAITFFALRTKEERIEKKFLYIAIPIFLMYMIFLPLYVGHDELFHWYRVFEITEGGFLPQIQDGSTGYVMPSEVGSSLPWRRDLEYKDIIVESLRTINYFDTEFISDVTMSVYSPIQYLPQIIGVFVGKILTSSSILISYIGRLANVAICIFLLYNAIKKMPYGKNIVLILSFIPIAIEGFVSLSGDGFTISTAFLFIAYILDIREQKKKMGKKDYLVLGLLGIVLAFCKIVYIPIVFMLLLLPTESFKSNRRRYIYVVSMICIFVLCNLTWLTLANPYLKVYTDGKSEYQISYVLKNPIRYCQNFLYTMQQYGMGYVEEMFGASMLWGSAVHNYTFVPIILISLMFLACLNDEEIKNKFKMRDSVIIVLIILMVIALMFTSLYVQWTAYAQETIEGVQGRYFLPIASLIFLFIGNFIGGKANFDKKKLNKVIIIGCIFVSFMCIMEFIVKYI